PALRHDRYRVRHQHFPDFLTVQLLSRPRQEQAVRRRDPDLRTRSRFEKRRCEAESCPRQSDPPSPDQALLPLLPRETPLRLPLRRRCAQRASPPSHDRGLPPPLARGALPPSPADRSRLLPPRASSPGVLAPP